MSNDQLQSIMALVVSFGNGRATNAMNHATDGPASDYVNTATQLQALESAIREAIAAPGVAQGWSAELSSDSRTQAARFNVCDNLAIDDDDFRFDALIVVHGDFGDGEKAKYVAEVCRRLNGIAAPSPTAEQPIKERPHG